MGEGSQEIPGGVTLKNNQTLPLWKSFDGLVLLK